MSSSFTKCLWTSCKGVCRFSPSSSLHLCLGQQTKDIVFLSDFWSKPRQSDFRKPCCWFDIDQNIEFFPFNIFPFIWQPIPVRTYFLEFFTFSSLLFLCVSLHTSSGEGRQSWHVREAVCESNTFLPLNWPEFYPWHFMHSATKNQNPLSSHCCCVATSLGKTRHKGPQEKNVKNLYHEPNLTVLHLWRALPLDPLFVTRCAGLVGNDPFLTHPTLSWHCNATTTLHVEFTASIRADSPIISLKWKITALRWCLQGTFSWKSQHTVLQEERKGYIGRMNEQWRQKLHSYLVLPIWWGFFNNNIIEADKLWLCMSICTYTSKTFASKSAFLSILKLKSGFDHHNERVITLSDLCLTCCPPPGCWLALTVENN